MRVLIVKLSSLGDIVHALPAVQDIRAAFPGAAIDWVAEPAFAPVLGRVEGVQRIVECPLRRWRRQGWGVSLRTEAAAFLRDLRACRYDAVIDLQGLTKSAVVARLAHGRRFGLANRTEGSSFEAPARWLADRAIRVEPHIHAVDRSRVLAARALGYPLPRGAARFGLHGRLAPPADGTPTLLLAHGASRADKRWPEPAWIALGRRAAALGWRLALPHAGADELARARCIAAGIGAGRAEVWPELPLDALIDRMAQLQGVVGVDSGLSHLAVALGLAHVQVYTLPTAWRTGPLPADRQAHTPGHGRPAQVAVEVAAGGASGAAEIEAVWCAWCDVSRAARRHGRAGDPGLTSAAAAGVPSSRPSPPAAPRGDRRPVCR
jgi:heptosyltransferase I